MRMRCSKVLHKLEANAITNVRASKGESAVTSSRGAANFRACVVVYAQGCAVLVMRRGFCTLLLFIQIAIALSSTALYLICRFLGSISQLQEPRVFFMYIPLVS